MIPGDVKSKVFPVGMKIPRGQVTNREGQAMVANCGPSGSMVDVFPDLERVIGTDILGSWSNLHIIFFTSHQNHEFWLILTATGLCIVALVLS